VGAPAAGHREAKGAEGQSRTPKTLCPLFSQRPLQFAGGFEWAGPCSFSLHTRLTDSIGTGCHPILRRPFIRSGRSEGEDSDFPHRDARVGTEMDEQ